MAFDFAQTMLAFGGRKGSSIDLFAMTDGGEKHRISLNEGEDHPIASGDAEGERVRVVRIDDPHVS